jgi:DNA-binding NarL/FixJ family response regulator
MKFNQVNMQRENVHLLVIEDTPGYLDELKQWLRDEFNYQNIETAQNTTDAEEKLKSSCDIVISDMRMERDDSGFTILNSVKKNNLSAVVIILTANDSVHDCRRAFREGAWDYISKNMTGNTFEALNDSIQDAIAYLDRWGNRPNQQWLQENRDTLESNYWGQWIAIVNQAVIETADTENELLKRLEERKLRRFTTTIQNIGDLRPIADLIALGESDRLEFKSTFQWCIRNNVEKKELQKSCLKTIAAFLNSDGGTLLIGVKDDGNIFGLALDLRCLKDASIDKFERHIIQLIENNIGTRFLPYITIRFARLKDEDVCGIYVRKADCKAFLKSDSISEFYIRTGNSSRALNVPDIYDHF